MPIDINDAFINAQFQTFVDFARGKDAGTKVRALIGNDGPEHTVGAKSANATASPTSKPWAGPHSSKKPSPSNKNLDRRINICRIITGLWVTQ